MPDTTPIRTAHLVAALAVGSLALLTLGLQPLLLGALLEAHRVSLEGVGLVAMAEIVALGLGVLLGDVMQPLSRLRSVTVGAALLAAALNALTLRASGDLGFLLVRAGAGLCEGLLVWVTTAVIVRAAQPDRVAGVFFVMQTIAQALLGLWLANAAVPAWGWPGAFAALAALLLLPLALALALPPRLVALTPPAVSGFAWSVRTALPLVLVFFQLAALGGLWAYVEPLGQDAGFSPPAVQTLIAACLGLQVVGGCCGSALVRRLPARAALGGGSLVLGAVALAVTHTLTGAGGTAFAALCAVFAFTWLFVTPFQMRMAFDADGSGRIASLIPAAQVFGIACGPLTASFVVVGEQARAVPWVSAGFAAAALLALGALALQPRRARVEPCAPQRG